MRLPIHRCPLRKPGKIEKFLPKTRAEVLSKISIERLKFISHVATRHLRHSKRRIERAEGHFLMYMDCQRID
jgi:hypothetical protein